MLTKQNWVDIGFIVTLIGMGVLAYFLDILCCRLLALFRLPPWLRHIIRLAMIAVLATSALLVAFYASSILSLRL